MYIFTTPPANELPDFKLTSPLQGAAAGKKQPAKPTKRNPRVATPVPEDEEGHIETSKRSPSARMNMLGKDRNHFKKIHTLHEKNGKIAALNRAGARADDESEGPANDDSEGPGQDSCDDSTKVVVNKKPAPKKKTTAGKKSATATPAPPTIQAGVIAKIAKGRKPDDRRPHRSVDFGYRSAPSDSEHETIRRTATTLSKRSLKLVKLKETIDRHAAWCPFVHLNKKLHHAHRRIRKLQNRRNSEPELPATLDELDEALNKRGGDNDDDQNEKEESNGEDEDSDSMEEIIIKVPRKRKTQVMAALNKQATQVEQPPQLSVEEAGSPFVGAPPTGNEDDATPVVDATAGATDKNARLTKAARSKDETLSKTSRNGHKERDEGAEADFLNEEDSPVNNGDNETGAGHATAGAPNQSGSASKAASPEDEASRKKIWSSGDEVEAQHNASLKRQRARDLAAGTTANAPQKRKVSETELTSNAEPASKTRKSRAGQEV
jgi:hypothetical protein